MGPNTVGSLRRRPSRIPDRAAPPPDVCPLEVVARVLSRCLPHAVGAAEVREKAVAFGLLRLPGSGADTELTVQTASRLFLAAYHLPVQVEQAPWSSIHDHLRGGRHVFLPLHESAWPDVVLVQDATAGDAEALLVSDAAAAAELLQWLPRDRLERPWATAGRLLIVAARQWTDLPTRGRSFFAGTRDEPGVYHWNSAECDTDAAGRILSF